MNKSSKQLQNCIKMPQTYFQNYVNMFPTHLQNCINMSQTYVQNYIKMLPKNPTLYKHVLKIHRQLNVFPFFRSEDESVFGSNLQEQKEHTHRQIFI